MPAEVCIPALIAALSAALTSGAQVRTALRDPTAERILKSKNFEEIYASLEKEMGALIATKDDHRTEVRRHSATKTPSNLYNDWIGNVEKLECEVVVLKMKYEKITKKFKGFNYGSRRRLRKKMKTKYTEAHDLLDHAKRLEVFLVEKEPESVVKVEAPDIEAFPALQGPLERILDLLTKDDITWIRILGAVGIGKTTVMQNLNNNEKVAEMFQIVIWVKVSTEDSKENLRTEDLQRAIVRRLRLDIGGINRVEDVADRIRVELEGKRYLLLLDDVKENLDLRGIGIRQNEKGSKIVLTTMLPHICSPMVNQNVKVEKLSPDEAWNMFQNVLNRPDLSDDRDIKPHMLRVVEWCDGLPLMIRMTASRFKQREDKSSWSDGCDHLKTWLQRGDDPLKEMYKALSFCYEYLEDYQKNCFYYSALYPEDRNIYIDRLLDCWAAGNLLGSDDNGEWMRITGREVLRCLKSGSLVEEGKHGKCVKLHKVIRQVALSNLLASTEHEYLVKPSAALREPPDVENWGKKRWISLVDNKLETLPDLPHCSLLSTLFLQKNSTLKIIPANFFENMEKLLVLDLHCTGITTLPLSGSWLKKLKVLYLNGCIGLVKLPPEIGRLQDLEVLDIRRSGVKDLPDQIKGLSRLRRLLLSFTIRSLTRLRRLVLSFTSSGDEEKKQAVEFNRNVISKISDLKELVIDVESLQHLWNGMLNAIIENVHSWTKLATFQLCFLDGVVDIIQVNGKTLKLCIPEANLGSFVGKLDYFDSGFFKVSIGWMPPEFPIPKSWPYESYVKYCSGKGVPLGVSKLLAEAGALILVNDNDLKHLDNSCSPSGLNEIQGCLIESCNKITTIVDGNRTNESPILPNLGKLYIKNLFELESLWVGPVQQGSLGKLHTLVLSGCPKLTRIFSHGIIEQLTEIQHLEIEKCDRVEEIIIMESENTGLGPRVLPRLVKLILVEMPQLRSIWSDDSLEWPSLERLLVHGCPRLDKLPFSQHNAMKLRSIETEENWWQALQWQTQEVKERFQRWQTQEVNERFQLYHTDR
ncbi:hypothetical protein RJ640_013538 [Escallonia rubra]|uniref:Uncharacterized protein n=1 Tax=Escallonia rubra TaxID=112253 RepID=A0AA88QSG2_9ASTE|nr:hypothetical protein RJ640_013538 [Escallonia rubra]